MDFLEKEILPSSAVINVPFFKGPTQMSDLITSRGSDVPIHVPARVRVVSVGTSLNAVH
jgi:hypothetical protein